MIKSISLEKFKAFSSLEDLEIRPLTVLCGVNSGGKSSILKSILLLKQSYENPSLTNEATLNGPYTTNGLMKDILYAGQGDTFTIKNTFNVRYNGKKFVKNSKQDISTAKELGKITGLSPRNICLFNIEVECAIQKGYGNDLWDTNFIKKYSICVTPIAVNGSPSIHDSFEMVMTYRHRKRGKYDIALVNFPTTSGEKVNYCLENCVCYFSGMRLTNLYYDSTARQCIELSDFLTNIYSISRIVADQYNGIKYLGPLRENPRRQYAIGNEYFRTNSTGADIPFVLAKNLGKTTIPELYPPATENNFEAKRLPEQKSLSELVQCWLDYFELGKLEIKNLQESLQINIKDCNIADVGFGISQILPVIVQGLSMDYEQTLILEQPEIHLHPRMQMRMSDFLLTISQTNHCAIVETHSDHIINRLVRRALEAPNEDLLNNIAIYFVENSMEGSLIHEIKIDRIRGISECPQEFFTQFASETSYIVKAGINNLSGGGI